MPILILAYRDSKIYCLDGFRTQPFWFSFFFFFFLFFACSEDTWPPSHLNLRGAWQARAGNAGPDLIPSSSHPDALPFPRSACLTSRPHQTGGRRRLGEVMYLSSWKAEQDCVKETGVSFPGTHTLTHTHTHSLEVCVCVHTCLALVCPPTHI